jgi:hypothetical protein
VSKNSQRFGGFINSLHVFFDNKCAADIRTGEQ